MISVGPDTTRAAARATAANLAEQLAALEKMPTKELAAKFQEIFGYPTRTQNRVNLRKRLAWKIQERAEGGLSDRALARIEELAPLAPARWIRPRGAPGAPALAGSAPPEATRRDPRLPPAGTVLTRVHKGAEHQVTVLDEGFEYRGARHRSLSAIARKITGTPWNGFLFFGCARRTEGVAGEAQL